MRSILSAIFLAGLMFTAACSQIQEPWVRDPDQLKAERSRTEAAQQTLRHRLLWVQTDR